MPYALSPIFRNLKVLLLIFGRFLSPVKEDGMMEVHRESGGFTPRKATSAVNRLSFVLLATPSGQNYAISVSYLSQLP
jgi:hypothetical protein